MTNFKIASHINMNTNEIKTILDTLNDTRQEIEDSAVVLSDGMVVASKIVHSFDEDKLGTIGAALFGLANQAAEQFEKDKAQEVMIKCSESYLLMVRINDVSVLFVDFKVAADIDLILQDCLVACSKLSKLV